MKKIIKIILLSLLILLLPGCFDYNELNTLGIVSLMSIDYEDDEYRVTLEILNASKEKKEASYFISGYGSTLASALNNTYNKMPVSPFLSHISTVIISKNVASEKLDVLYDYFLRNVKMRKDFYLLISEDIAEIPEFEANNATSLGEYINKTVANSLEKNDKYYAGNFIDITNNYLQEMSYIIGGVKINKKSVALEGNYYIENNKFKQNLDEKAMLFENMMTDQVKSFEMNADFDFEVYSLKFEKKVKNDTIELNLNCNVRLLDALNYETEKNSELAKMEENIETKLKKYIENCIMYAKELDSDIYNFDHLYYLYMSQKYEKGIWKKLNYEINVEASINEKGFIFNANGADKS